MLFPMYTVAADVLLQMTKVEPHEKLKALNKIGIERRACKSTCCNGIMSIAALKTATKIFLHVGPSC